MSKLKQSPNHAKSELTKGAFDEVEDLDYSERRSKTSKKNSRKNWGFIAINQIIIHYLTILRKMLLNKRSKSNQVMVNPRKDCLKLIRIKKLKK